MKLKVILVLLSLLLLNTQAAPIDLEDVEEDPELIGGYYEGDMILPLERNGVVNVYRTWPLGMVFYKIDEIFGPDHISYIHQAMQAIESVSCIRFHVAPNDTDDYIMFSGNGKGCYAAVGYVGKKQTLNLQINSLDRGCFIKGKIMHELLHALGFYHQHSASNRDDYIKVMFENIKDNYQQFFKKFNENLITDFGIEYDYDSVMHYSTKAFTKNGKDTIIPLTLEAKIGQREGLSIKDVLKLNLLYNCPIGEQ